MKWFFSHSIWGNLQKTPHFSASNGRKVVEVFNTLVLATVIFKIQLPIKVRCSYAPRGLAPGFSIHEACICIKIKLNIDPVSQKNSPIPLTGFSVNLCRPLALQHFPHWLLGNHLSYCACLFYDNCHYDYFLIIRLGL